MNSIIVGIERTAALQLNLGIVITDGGATGNPDAGIVGGVGVAVGPEVGATAFLTFLVGGRENFEGRTDSLNFSAGLELEFHKNATTRDWIGFTIGYGPGAGVSLSATNSAAATIGDAIDLARSIARRISEIAGSIGAPVAIKENSCQ